MASEAEIRKATATPMVISGHEIKDQGSIDTGTPASATSTGSTKANLLGRTPSGQFPYDGIPERSPAPRAQPSHEYADVIDRGIVTMEVATNMFNYYVNYMAPHLPAVVFPSGT